MTKPQGLPTSRVWLRRLRRAVLVAGSLGLILGAVLALEGRQDRANWFEQRVGQVASVERAPVSVEGPFTCDDVTLTSTTGLQVRLRLLLPVPQSGPVPAAVVMGGHRTGRDAADLVGDPVNVVVAALDYPIEGEERLRGLGPIIGALPRIRQGLLDTPPAAALVARWVSTLPEVDPARIELVGVSLGGVFAPAAAGIEPLLRRVWLVHGGASDHREWLDHVMRRRVDWSAPRRAASRLAFELGRGPAFAPKRWLPLSDGRELVIVAGRADEQLPVELVQDLADSYTGPLRLSWTDGGHVNTRRKDLVRELIGTVLSGIHGEPPPLYGDPD